MADSVPDPPKEETAAPAAAGQESSAQLADLIARAGRSYAAKDYNGASELYSQATELQARLNGEMTPQNAELLYLYGRCLYHVGAGKSEVLGGQDADMEVTDGAEKRREPVGSTAAAPTGAPPTTVRRKMMDEALSEVMEHKDRAAEEKAPPKKPANNALFQITGDENWDVSDEDEDADADGEGVDGEAGGDAEDDDDDDDELTVAWETLDLARVLYNRQLEELQEEGAAAAEAGKEQGDASARIRTVKERLADIHDLLAEISLGHEGYDAAVADSKSSLSLKKELYPPESSVVAEAHFKLSLALEFASIKAAPDQAGGAADPDSMQVDRAVREEAAQQMEAAIQSARLRVAEEERELETGAEAEAEAENERLKKSINEVKEMIAEMEERVSRLSPLSPHATSFHFANRPSPRLAKCAQNQYPLRPESRSTKPDRRRRWPGRLAPGRIGRGKKGQDRRSHERRDGSVVIGQA